MVTVDMIVGNGERTEVYFAIWAAAYGSAFSTHVLANKYHAEKAAKYASNVADRAVMAARDLAEART